MNSVPKLEMTIDFHRTSFRAGPKAVRLTVLDFANFALHESNFPARKLASGMELCDKVVGANTVSSDANYDMRALLQ